MKEAGEGQDAGRRPCRFEEVHDDSGRGAFLQKRRGVEGQRGMRNIASAGIVKKDLNGTIAGTSSRNFLQNPMEIVIAPPGILMCCCR